MMKIVWQKLFLTFFNLFSIFSALQTFYLIFLFSSASSSYFVCSYGLIQTLAFLEQKTFTFSIHFICTIFQTKVRRLLFVHLSRKINSHFYLCPFNLFLLRKIPFKLLFAYFVNRKLRLIEVAATIHISLRISNFPNFHSCTSFDFCLIGSTICLDFLILNESSSSS